MFTEKPVSASMNTTMTASGLTTLCMPDFDSNFSNFIENDFVEFSVSFAIQNLCPIISEFAWPVLGN